MTNSKINLVQNAIEWGTKSLMANVKAAAAAAEPLYHTGGKKLLSKSTQKQVRKALSERVGDLGPVGRLTVKQKAKSMLPGGARALRQEALKSTTKAVGSASLAGAVIDAALAAKEVVPGAFKGEIEPEIAAEHVGRQALKGGIASGVGTSAVVIVTACTGGVGTLPAIAICATVSGITHHQLTKAEAKYMPSPFSQNQKLVQA